MTLHELKAWHLERAHRYADKAADPKQNRFKRREYESLRKFHAEAAEALKEVCA